MNYVEFIQNAFKTSADNLKKLSESQEIIQQVAKAAEVIVESYKKGGTLYIAGNGGSAADAQHIAAELVVKLDKDRTPLKSFAMTVDTSLITAIGNDFGYDWVFHRQVRAMVKPNDVFLAITTSGNSMNIIKGLEACREVKGTSILLTGKNGGKIKQMELADHYVIACGEHTAQIQEAHIAIYHTLCFLIEKGLIEAGVIKYV